ncbi:flagellar motor protein MotB [Alkalibaculum sporogenes]|nr:flagellar motor protein MotB [Alkalibaculum sporogenes]
MSRRKLVKKESNSSGSGWITTYSDLMSLLLTFFILLYSMSTIDTVKFKNISESIQAVLMGVGQPAVMEGQQNDQPIPIDDEKTISDIIDSTTIKEEILVMYEKVKEYIMNEGLEANISVTVNRRGVYVDIKDTILFESGSAEIKVSGLAVLKRLEGLVNDFDNDIVIEGHTDDVPINRILYPSNWELSTARAVSVVRYLSEVEQVDPKRLSAVGYSEYRPIAPNDSVGNRAINRRVNILIIFDEESEVSNGTRGN